MMLKAFSLLDTKTGVYSQPNFFVHKGQAIRGYTELGSDMSTVVGRHPYDFRIFLVGEFDDSVGIFHTCPVEDFGTVGSLVDAAVSERKRSAPELLEPNGRGPDLSRATAAEVVAARAAERE